MLTVKYEQWRCCTKKGDLCTWFDFRTLIYFYYCHYTCLSLWAIHNVNIPGYAFRCTINVTTYLPKKNNVLYSNFTRNKDFISLFITMYLFHGKHFFKQPTAKTRRKVAYCVKVNTDCALKYFYRWELGRRVDCKKKINKKTEKPSYIKVLYFLRNVIECNSTLVNFVL